MGKFFSAWSLFLLVSVLAVKVLSQEGFDLSDALDEDDTVKAPTQKPKPAVPSGGGAGAGAGADLDLSDVFSDDEKTTTPPKVVPKATKAPVKPKPKPDETQDEFFDATLRPGLLPHTTRSPSAPRAPPKGQPAADGFDLSDALDPNNDIGGKDKNKGTADKGAGGGGRGDGSPNNRGDGGGSFSDSDLFDVGKDESYNPDKGKGECTLQGKRWTIGSYGGRGTGQLDPADDSNSDTMATTGTISGIVSAVALALVGAVSSYVSYQKKKFCFSIQQSLNTDLVKADAPDAVVATEPQVQQTLLEPPNAEPPSEENTV